MNQLVRPLEWMRAIDFSNLESANARIAAEFTGWVEPLTALITKSNTASHLMPRRARARTLPCLMGRSWARRRRVAFTAYEAVVLPRGASEAIDAHQTVDLCFGSTAPHRLVEFFKSAGGNVSERGEWLHDRGYCR